MCKRRASLFAALLAILAALAQGPADARDARIIRDAEIENTIRLYATPLFQAAGLSPKAIDVYLIDDSSLNAFVTPGLRMFLHTGLLMRAADPLQVIGVIAHETGHLAAGHTATRGDGVRRSANTVIAAYLLGLSAALATGRGEIATAAIRGGQDLALKGLLSYTRSQESAADQYAITLLEGTGQSARGLLEFMQVLGGQEVLFATSQDPYLRTHPLTEDRVRFVEDQISRSRYSDVPAKPELVRLHARMQAKLVGFLEPITRVLDRYPETDQSMPARYARAIAYFQAGEIDNALDQIDALLAELPDDPYFHELKGQMLLEHGRIPGAVAAYDAAAQRLPDSALIRLSLAQAQIEMNDPTFDKKALTHLAAALAEDPSNSFAWRLSAIAYGRQGDIGMTALALAERALIRGEAPEAEAQAVRAQKILSEGSPAWLRAMDVEKEAQRLAKN